VSKTRAIAALLACQCVLVSGLTLSVPFLALYLHRQRGMPMDQVGLTIGAMMLTTAVAQSLSGELSDLFGGKPVMQAAVAARALFSTLTGWAIAGEWSVGAVVALSFCSAFGGSFYDPAARTWLAQACDPQDRLRVFGWQRMSVNLGWAVGPAVGGLLAERSYAGLFGASGAVAFLCFLWFRWGLEHLPPAREGGAFRPAEALAAAGDRRFLLFCLLCLVSAAVHAQLVVGLSVHGASFAGLSERQIGLLFTLNGAMVVLLQNAASSWMERRSLATALGLGCLCYAVGYAGTAFAMSFGLMLAVVAVVTLGELVVTPGQHTLAANLAPAEVRGRYIGFHGLTHQIGHAFGPLLAGVGLKAFGPRSWLLVGAVSAATAFGFFGMRRRLEEEA